MVTFLNQPKLVQNPAQEVFNQRRLALVPKVESFLSQHPRFWAGDVEVSFAEKGVSSLVAFVRSGAGKVVLKIPLRHGHADGEGLFLRTWAAAGVRVPEVLEEGSIGEHRYTLMEFVDAPLLSARAPGEMVGINRELGRTMRRMHEPIGEGYGNVADGRGEFESFAEWLDSELVQERIAYVRERGLLGDEHGSLVDARRAFEALVASGAGSRFCHNDFGAGNIFDTDPITVFDPHPYFNLGYMDLARTILLGVSNGDSREATAELIGGYFDGQPHDEPALRAAILLNAYLKLKYWHRSGKLEAIERSRTFLSNVAAA